MKKKKSIVHYILYVHVTPPIWPNVKCSPCCGVERSKEAPKMFGQDERALEDMEKDIPPELKESWSYTKLV
jgi:hypothetical protein